MIIIFFIAEISKMDLWMIKDIIYNQSYFYVFERSWSRVAI